MNRIPSQNPPTPWQGIAESILPTVEARLDHADAVRSPCESCPTSPCCSYLPLGGFRTVTLTDLDYARYLLNFERIELGLSSAGDWSIFYRAPCRYLDTSTFACTVHDRPEQPHICRRYNPYHCWYKPALTSRVSSDYIRVDHSRFEYLLKAITFDDRGKIIESPDWSELVHAIENIYDLVRIEGTTGISADPASTSEPLPIYKFSHAQLQEPCTGCAAYCCKVLIFPIGQPADISGLDYLQFCLGFPGVRVGISDAQWTLLIETRCRHLKANRCSVFGRPERPITCSYYDEWRCSFKHQFDGTNGSSVLHVALEQYRQILNEIELDQYGTVRRIPSVSELRSSQNKLPVNEPASMTPEAALA